MKVVSAQERSERGADFHLFTRAGREFICIVGRPQEQAV